MYSKIKYLFDYIFGIVHFVFNIIFNDIFCSRAKSIKTTLVGRVFIWCECFDWQYERTTRRTRSTSSFDSSPRVFTQRSLIDPSWRRCLATSGSAVYCTYVCVCVRIYVNGYVFVSSIYCTHTYIGVCVCVY